MSTGHADTRRGLLHSTRGLAFLVWVFLLVAVSLVLAGSLFVRSANDLSLTNRSQGQERAFQLAEAGLDNALQVLRTSSLQWDDDLLGVDGVAGTADDGILSFGQTVALSPGSYTVRVFDDNDELTPPDNPTADLDGVIHIQSIGTVNDTQRTINAWIWSLFNHAIAADIDVVLQESSAMGSIHANQNIVVTETSTLLGTSQATAAGTFVFSPGTTLVHTYGDLVGGDPPITFLEPNVASLEASVNRWNAPNWNGTIGLVDQEVVGYRLGHGIAPDTVSLTGAATIVVFDGKSVTFRERIGSFDANGNCTQTRNLNVIAVGGGSITFQESACLRGLIWAQGPITLAEKSNVVGVVVSADSTVTVAEKSIVTFDRTVLQSSLLAGFWGHTIRAWQDQ